MAAITVSLRKNAKDNKKRKTVKASKYIQLLVQLTEMITIGRYFFPAIIKLFSQKRRNELFDRHLFRYEKCVNLIETKQYFSAYLEV